MNMPIWLQKKQNEKIPIHWKNHLATWAKKHIIEKGKDWVLIIEEIANKTGVLLENTFSDLELNQ